MRSNAPLAIDRRSPRHAGKSRIQSINCDRSNHIRVVWFTRSRRVIFSSSNWMPWTPRNHNVPSAWIPWWFEVYRSRRSHRIPMSMFYAVTFMVIINGVSKAIIINQENVHCVERLVRWFRLLPDWNLPSTSSLLRIKNQRRRMLFNHVDIWLPNRQLYIGQRLKYRTVSKRRSS